MSDKQLHVFVRGRGGGLTKTARRHLKSRGVKRVQIERVPQAQMSREAKAIVREFERSLPADVHVAGDSPLVVLQTPKGTVDLGRLGGALMACKCQCSSTMSCGGGGGGH
jgi:hypothetical protein